MCRAAQGGGGAAWDAARAVLCQLSARRFSARSCSQEAFRKKRIGMKKMLPIRYLPKKKKKCLARVSVIPAEIELKNHPAGKKKKKRNPSETQQHRPPAPRLLPARAAAFRHPGHSRLLVLLLPLFLPLLLPLLRHWAGSRSPLPRPRCPIGAADSASLSRLAAAQLLPEDVLAFA